jgi:predicted transcriptional regulator
VGGYSPTHKKEVNNMEIADIDKLSLKTLKRIQSEPCTVDDLSEEPEIKEDLEQITKDLQNMGVIEVKDGIVTITKKGVKVLEKLNELHSLNVN